MAKLAITQKRSKYGRSENQQKNLEALGLRKIRQTVVLNDTPQIRGMILKVHHLVDVVEQ